MSPRIVATLACALCAVVLEGCATTSSRPPDAAEEAAKIERIRCGPGVEEATLAPIFDGELVESAEPLYSGVSSGGRGAGGNYSQLIGARIRLKAYQGYTAEWLDRALECHSARRVLGQIPSTVHPNDPFWLPQRVVDIEVAASRDGFQVFVRGSDIKEAEEILMRANAFVEARTRR